MSVMISRCLAGGLAGAILVGGCSSSDDAPASEMGYPDGCEFLADPGIARCERDDARCEFAQESDHEYDFWLNLDDVADTYSDAELEERQDCVVRWLEDLGLDAEARSTDQVLVTTTWDAVAEVTSHAVITGYAPYCQDEECDHCEAFGESACEADPFCWPLYAEPVADSLKCLEESTFAGCANGDGGCSDAETFGEAEDGTCWFFSSECGAPGFDYGPCGGLDVGEDLPVCD